MQKATEKARTFKLFLTTNVFLNLKRNIGICKVTVFFGKYR